jgi:hypothetical protein
MEELKEIALELLSRYCVAESSNICEFSGNIQEDLNELEAKRKEYKQRIEEASK